MCGGERFWLSVLARRLVVLALVLFFAVSVTDASPIIALDHLRRDLGALQAQLEQIDAVAGEDAAQPVELDTDLGDGSPAFRRQILVTIASCRPAQPGAAVRRLSRGGRRAARRRCRDAVAQPLRAHRADRAAGRARGPGDRGPAPRPEPGAAGRSGSGTRSAGRAGGCGRRARSTAATLIFPL